MHPAPSVIAFTVLSGLGFGLLIFLSLGLPDVTGLTAFLFYSMGFALTLGGLAASSLHLGRPERALLAFTQWRTSWLSREAVLAVAALLATGLNAAGAIFFHAHLPGLGPLAAALCLTTVFATAMIYTQLRTVPRWHQPATPVLFVLVSLGGGALLAGQQAALPLLGLAGAAQLWHWRHGDTRFGKAGSTMETATGLGAIGPVRQFEPPHTGSNYLLDEMVFVIARKHALRLRFISLFFMVFIPCTLIALPGSGTVSSAAAALSYLVGALTARWLFFAEAEHVVGLYYGKR